MAWIAHARQLPRCRCSYVILGASSASPPIEALAPSQRLELCIGLCPSAAYAPSGGAPSGGGGGGSAGGGGGGSGGGEGVRGEARGEAWPQRAQERQGGSWLRLDVIQGRWGRAVGEAYDWKQPLGGVGWISATEDREAIWRGGVVS
jgi:hypothetical protein